MLKGHPQGDVPTEKQHSNHSQGCLDPIYATSKPSNSTQGGVPRQNYIMYCVADKLYPSRKSLSVNRLLPYRCPLALRPLW